MIGVREKRSDSWLDPHSAGLLGWKLGRRLWERCKGRAGLFLTLTYDRSSYGSPADLYHQSRARQDVALFMRRLGRALKHDFSGQWLCKLEFQPGGWVHWHLCVLGLTWADSRLVAHVWGHGFVKVKAMTKRRCHYITKYVAKAGAIPGFLLNEPPRSVRVVRVSKGFWGETVPRPDDSDYQKWGPIPAGKVPGYVPIGLKISRQRGTVIRVGRKSERVTFSVALPPVLVALELRRRCGRPIEGDTGWMNYAGSLDDVDMALAAAGRLAERPESKRDAPAPRSGALNLRGTGEPDAVPIPRWLRLILEADGLDAWDGERDAR